MYLRDYHSETHGALPARKARVPASSQPEHQTILQRLLAAKDMALQSTN
jgi:hypothetical protein